MNNWCDTGVNLFSSQFDADRHEVMLRAKAAGVSQMLLIASDLAEARLNLDWCQQYEHCRTTAGIHPHQASAAADGWQQQLTILLQQPQVVAVGECGLDFNRDFSPRPVQQQVFAEQLQLAKHSGKPVYLHQRDAFDCQLAILQEQHISHGVAHCFTGDTAQLRAWLDLGLYIGITGWVCDERRGQDLQQAVAYIPSDRILLETDAPYLLPRTLKPRPAGGRNEPSLLTAIATQVAMLKGCSLPELALQCWQNSQKLFGFDTALQQQVR